MALFGALIHAALPFCENFHKRGAESTIPLLLVHAESRKGARPLGALLARAFGEVRLDRGG